MKHNFPQIWLHFVFNEYKIKFDMHNKKFVNKIDHDHRGKVMQSFYEQISVTKLIVNTNLISKQKRSRPLTVDDNISESAKIK